MTKRRRRVKKEVKRQTNWMVIGGVVVLGIVIMGGLLALTLRNSETTEVVTLATFCESNPENCVFEGSAETAVTVVEVSDYGCPHCRDFHKETLPALKQQYVNSGQVRWITLPFALGGERIPATNAALCANEQNAFAPMSELLFDQQGSSAAFTRDGYLTAASSLGLDMAAFTECVDDGRYDDTITRNIRVANGLRVNSTPTFFINDRRLEGAQPFAIFQQQIDAALNSN
ncbi:MAG: DsbA family protein [Ardenticatenaceae bacterium]|nr:DsbA family protein [Ardenticatenaceae bacterium]